MPKKKPSGPVEGEKKPNNGESAQNFIAVRWPSSARQELKIAAARHNPPMTMSEYLVNCFRYCEKNGGLEVLSQGGGPKQAKANVFAGYGAGKTRAMLGVIKAIIESRDRERIDCLMTVCKYLAKVA